MRYFLQLFFVFMLVLTGNGLSVAQTLTPASTPKMTPTLTLEDEKKGLEIEKLQLENERLKFEMEKLKLQATQTQVPGKFSDESRKAAIEALQTAILQKTEAMAKENKAKDDLVILDLVNSEIWYKGVRYNVHEWFDMAGDNHWKLYKTVNQRYMDGDPQYLYRYKNITLLRYESQPRGKLIVTAPSKEGDFQVITPEGVSFDSSVGDIRNAFQSAYFSYAGEKHDNKLKILKYLHNMGFLAFSDRLEFAFDKEGKLVDIRYGVLDEH